MSIPEAIKSAFAEETTEALKTFPNTIGQCVALCAYISVRLSECAISNKVALGSLSCNGIKTFQYKKPIPALPSQSMEWDGHAWIEFQDHIIGEPSLFRTARALQPESNLRRHLKSIGLLERGAILFTTSDALNSGLKYGQKSYLNASAFQIAIEGLTALNRAV